MKTITKPNINLKDIELTIGVCGKRLSGKDYISDKLVDFSVTKGFIMVSYKFILFMFQKTFFQFLR